jgi:tungstate transport system substrate-binding protein
MALMILSAGRAAAQASAPVAEPRAQIMLASTIGPIDAGIVAVLEEAFERETGIRVRHVGAGTGAALNLAKTGNFDVVMVHARALEEQFVAEGYGTKRYDLMYNDFVIMGPPADPAGIRGEASAAAALRKIAAAQALFISRGDKSGTHVKELEVWQTAGLKPQGAWYKVYEQGAEGNAKTLLYADTQRAYTVIDRATYLTLKKQLSLAVLVERDPLLLNYITIIPVNPARFPGVKHAEALEFVNWLTSRKGQTIIRDFGKDVYGAPLFFPNSEEGKSL